MSQPLKIFHYFVNWNDSFYLPFIKKHYGVFCERIVMYNNHSSDDSVEIAKKLGFEVRTYGNATEFNDAENIAVKNNCWKEAKGIADFVIVSDVDEFLYHPNLLKKLRTFKKYGITLPRVQGYDMVSDQLPKLDVLEIKTGRKSAKYSKSLIFDPNNIHAMNYDFGCHSHKSMGVIKKSWSKLYVLHYRNVGGYNRMIERQKIYAKRLSAFNVQNRHGIEYLLNEEEKKAIWRKIAKKKQLLKFIRS